jgi:hypothetical protein
MAKIKPEFDKRGVKIIGLSVDPLDRHSGWASDIQETQGFGPNFPMIADVDYNVSKLSSRAPSRGKVRGSGGAGNQPDLVASGRTEIRSFCKSDVEEQCRAGSAIWRSQTTLAPLREWTTNSSAPPRACD